MILNLIRSTYGNTFKYGPAIPGYHSYFSRSVAAKGSLKRRRLGCHSAFVRNPLVRTIEDHPVTIKYTILSLIILGGMTIYFWGPKATNRELVKKLRSGSNPKRSRSTLKYEIDRPDVVKSIQKLLFESDPDNGKIGVILGPEGSGKSVAVIEACSNPPGPKYILYQEVYQTSEFARQLAHAAAIPLSRNIFDNIFNGLGLDSQFYKYPDDPIQAITYVMSKVARRSKEEIKKQHGQLKYLPCFVIDAAEILAVYDPGIFDALLLLAKHYIHVKRLRIVLVDSNGIALSKINKSLKHLVVDIVEVRDIMDENAEEYLLKRTNMSNNLAKRLVGLIGGRLLHLTYAVDAYQNLDSDQNEDLAYESIKKHLFIKVIAPVNNVIADTIPLSELIVKHIISCDSKPLLPSELKMYLRSNLKDTKPAKAQTVIDALVNANLLRYNAEGKLVWHSRFVEAEMKIQYSKSVHQGFWSRH